MARNSLAISDAPPTSTPSTFLQPNTAAARIESGRHAAELEFGPRPVVGPQAVADRDRPIALRLHP
jgi:hypothetical protein